ncbi:MAG: ISL3 family transposase [Candidatus Binatia bacterium]
MQLQTILNRVERHKSFIYKRVSWDERAKRPTLRVQIEARANGRPICSGCRRKRPGYDRLAERTWEFVPLWQITVLFIYALRRVNCPTCGVVVERVPWASGKCRQTNSYRLFLATWAKRLSWQDVADIFHTSWDTVFRAVNLVVSWGIIHSDLRGVTAIGVDEIQWKRGHHYLTLVYRLDGGVRRLLWVGKERTESSLQRFFDLHGSAILPTLQFVCSDMWQPYLQTIAARAQNALHVLDRYHIVARLNKAIDKVRAEEARRMERDGYEPILKHSRWCLLKRPANWTKKQVVKMRELLQYNLRTVRAYLLKEDFQRFWEYQTPHHARRFLRQWCTRSMRSQLEPVKEVARSLREHEELLMNWFRAKGEISAGIVEGMNNKAKLTMRKAYGFRTYEAIETALYHQLGHLPEPESTHKFC